MISCVDFIPAYSELFSYLDSRAGYSEVQKFWDYLFVPDGKGIPLITFLKEEGITGCWSYWKGSLNEEAADFTMYLNVKRGFFYNVMHYCPSKGRLLKLAETEGFDPYPRYCFHCDYYRKAAEKAGLCYIYNFNGIDHAACSMLIYDPTVFDGRVIIDEDTLVMDRKASQNEYFHRDFHSSMNNGIRYLGENYGEDAIREYLVRYTEHVLRRVLEDAETRGLDAVEDHIRLTYRKEKAEDALVMVRNGDTLHVWTAYCPAVRHLKATNREVTRWFSLTTSVPMKRIAEAAGAEFIMECYDDANGAMKYHFTKKQ